jgi:hypothetical protein
MKHVLKTIIRNVKSVKGNSLAEFATTTALMATLAATAAPKLSEMSEGAKGEKSRNEIDKIIKQAGQFYQDTADQEGRGRFPNQKKFDVAIGGGSSSGVNYDNGAGGLNGLSDDITKSTAHEAAILKDLGITTSTPTGGWDRFDEAHSNQWQSVFDASYTKAAQDPDPLDASSATAGGILAAYNYNANYTPASGSGATAVAASGIANEWDALFGDEVLSSKFQDGHYVYTVVAGGGTGNDVYPPTIYVADVESAVDFNNVLMP